MVAQDAGEDRSRDDFRRRVKSDIQDPKVSKHRPENSQDRGETDIEYQQEKQVKNYFP
jgi:hypothetical protein